VVFTSTLGHSLETMTMLVAHLWQENTQASVSAVSIAVPLGIGMEGKETEGREGASVTLRKSSGCNVLPVLPCAPWSLRFPSKSSLFHVSTFSGLKQFRQHLCPGASVSSPSTDGSIDPTMNFVSAGLTSLTYAQCRQECSFKYHPKCTTSYQETLFLPEVCDRFPLGSSQLPDYLIHPKKMHHGVPSSFVILISHHWACGCCVLSFCPNS
jgi:hypothetical protein